MKRAGIVAIAISLVAGCTGKVIDLDAPEFAAASKCVSEYAWKRSAVTASPTEIAAAAIAECAKPIGAWEKTAGGPLTQLLSASRSTDLTERLSRSAIHEVIEARYIMAHDPVAPR